MILMNTVEEREASTLIWLSPGDFQETEGMIMVAQDKALRTRYCCVLLFYQLTIILVISLLNATAKV